MWYYIAGVYDGSLASNNLSIYVKQGGTTLTATSTLTNGGALKYNASYRLNMGKLPWGYGFFVGHVDEARMWSIALTSTEINTQMNQPGTVQDGSCISYWRFENTLVPATPGTTITDEKGIATGKFYSCAVDVHSFSNSGIFYVEDNDKTWTVDYWKGYNAKTVSGTGIDQSNAIISNTVVRMNFQNAFVPNPALDSPLNSGDTWFGIEHTTETSQWVSSDAPYPVELSLFEGKISFGKVVLHWMTATEVNNFGFYVESYRKETTMWESIGFLRGNGNSNAPKEYTFTDDLSESGKNNSGSLLRYRLKQIDNDGSFTYSQEVEILNMNPSEFGFSQNYPNPFNPSTVINYQLPEGGMVSLKVYDVVGNEVATLVNEEKEAGYHAVTFNAINISTGVYFYQIRAGDFTGTKKLVLIK